MIIPNVKILIENYGKNNFETKKSQFSKCTTRVHHRKLPSSGDFLDVRYNEHNFSFLKIVKKECSMGEIMICLLEKR